MQPSTHTAGQAITSWARCDSQLLGQAVSQLVEYIVPGEHCRSRVPVEERKEQLAITVSFNYFLWMQIEIKLQ